MEPLTEKQVTDSKDIFELYASNDCKNCWGKGWYKIQQGIGYNITIRKNGPIANLLVQCQCSKKNQAKFAAEAEFEDD